MNESGKVTIDVELAVDLAFLLRHVGDASDYDERAAMHESLVRFINASGQWHLTLDEELPGEP